MDIIKKLRTKMLILNMAITSSVVLAAFAFIFFITYRNINTEIEEKLNLSSTGGQVVYQNETANSISASVGSSGTLSITSDDFQLFNMLVDSQSGIIEKASGINFGSDFFEEAALAAMKNTHKKNEVTLGGRQWRYAVTPIIQIDNSEDSKDNTVNVEGYLTDLEEADMYSVVFLDITSYQKTLFDLFITLLVVGAITLAAIYLVSIFFSNRTTKPLVQAWQKQKQFIADASHELKTPLSIINANYDVLLSNKSETIESQIKWIEYMRIGMDRMSKLINDLLLLAKFDDDKVPVVKIRFNFSKTVQSVILSMKAAYLNKEIRLSENIEEEVFLESDEEGIKQVITILMDNAIKYTNQNGEIKIRLVKENGKIVFLIKNTGKSVSDSEKQRIFDRFYRSDQARSHDNGSYGLGLSIAKTILDGVGGEIQVQSIEEKWTVFILVFKHD